MVSRTQRLTVLAERLGTRTCGKCGEPSLNPVSRKMELYNSVIRYKCGNCGAEVDIKPLASIGSFITVGFLALAFWGFILFTGSGRPGYITLSIFGLAILGFLYVTIAPLLVHLANPVGKAAEDQPELAVPDNGHVARKAILWVETLGLLGGIIAPLIFIGIVLGAATLIGYINFTYF